MRRLLCDLTFYLPVNCLEKLSFLVVEGHCLQLQNAGKHIPATIEFQNFPGEHAPGPPQGARPSGPCQFFARVSNSVALLLKTLMNPLRSQPGDNNEISSRVYINFDGHKQSHKEIIISEKKKQNKQQRTMLDHHCHYLCRCMNHCLDHPYCLK